MANYMLRGIPDEVYDMLKAAAKRNHRSLNGEILMRLERSVRDHTADPEAVLRRIQTRNARHRVPTLDSAALRALKDQGRP